MKKKALFLIDVQNDFCDPRGALYVTGAEEDCIRLTSFINNMSNKLNEIIITLDCHHNYDIAHPLFWISKEGTHPYPFTLITEQDINQGKWRTTKDKDLNNAENYLLELEKQGKGHLCIWPAHCLIGSWGAQVQSDVFKSLNSWELNKVNQIKKVLKGDDYRTEHYGALKAEVPQEDNPSTKINKEIIKRLEESDIIYIAGQALDYCVAATVRQIIENISKENLHKLVLLEDCCSSVGNPVGLSEKFVTEIREKGVRVSTSKKMTEIRFSFKSRLAP